MLQSTKNPDFAHLSDADVSALYADAEKRKDAAIAYADANGWTDADYLAIDSIDTELFIIDNELCARGL